MAVNSTNSIVQTTLTAPTILYSINAQTGTSYTAVSTDAASFVTMTNAASNIFYIPTNASVPFAIGTTLNVFANGDGLTTIQAVTSGTTTIRSVSGNGGVTTAPVIRQKYSGASCIKIDTDVWAIIGDVY